MSRRSFLTTGSTAAGLAVLVQARPARALASSLRPGPPQGSITVAAGQTYTVTATTRVAAVSIEAGGILTAPAGYSLTMTVNGVETGQQLMATDAADTAFVAGSWRGDIVLTVTTADDIAWQQHTYPFRQALYVGAAGIVPAYSVLAAAVGGQFTSQSAAGVRINSTGQCFDGVYVSDGSYTLYRPVISLTGNGRCDFVGYGAAAVANGTAARLVLDGAMISNQGALRTAVVADNGATVVVKNSTLQVRNGVLPSDYVPTVKLDTMQSAPWMLSIDGNVRATNLLGNNTIAAYVNSSIASQTWGVLSTDAGSDCTLVAINSRVANTGQDGYGTYVIGNATEYLLGTQFDVGTYATIFTGGTQVNSSHATFLNKGQDISVTVDGSGGAALNPGDGILVPVMDNDDPGPVMVNGQLEDAGVYTQPTGESARDTSFDVITAHATDSTLAFSDIRLRGDFYNGMRGDLNLVLSFTASQVTGVISATLATHHVDTIDSGNWQELGAVTNTPQAAINNGVIVSLAGGTRWTMTGTSYLTSLTLDTASSVTAPPGRGVSMTVDGTVTAIEPGGSYSGAIVLTLA